MRIQLTEVHWLSEHQQLPVQQLAELSGLSEADIHELADYGAIEPIDPQASPRAFAAQSLIVARTACRLRDDFELNLHGVALALTLLDRVHDLEAQLRDLRARLPHRGA
jgi:chaperone modulatory protein CbpM